jgi:hypothetical protein
LTSLAQGAVLFDDLGNFQRKVTARSPEAQAFFDQGMRLTYAFKHDVAARSFARAVQQRFKTAWAGSDFALTRTAF